MGRTLMSAALDFAIDFDLDFAFDFDLEFALALDLDFADASARFQGFDGKVKVKGGGQECPPHTSFPSLTLFRP